jgi:hypothetical protein
MAPQVHWVKVMLVVTVIGLINSTQAAVAVQTRLVVTLASVLAVQVALALHRA